MTEEQLRETVRIQILEKFENTVRKRIIEKKEADLSSIEVVTESELRSFARKKIQDAILKS